MSGRFITITIALVMALGLPTSAWSRPPGPASIAKRSTPTGKVRRATPQGMPRSFWLPVVTVKGRQYYRTFRVTSEKGFQRIADKNNSFRFFQGGGQYGDGFYLFRSLRDARKFAGCETARGAERNVIAEVLLPRDKMDAVRKAEVPRELDWAMQRPRTDQRREQMRERSLSSHLVYGRWAPSPHLSEPVYDRMNGAKQIAVVQRGQPSILQDAVIRQLGK